MDKILLNGGYLLEGYLHAHIAPRHHDAVGGIEYLVDVVNALGILYLGDYAGIVPPQRLCELPQIDHVRTGTDKRSGDEIKAHFRAEGQVVHIRVGDIGHRKLYPRHVYSLVVGELSSVLHLADDIRPGDRLNHQLDNAVVYQDARARRNVLRKVIEGHRGDLIGALHIAGGESKCIAVLYLHRLMILKIPKPYLRALGIQQAGDAEPQLAADTSDGLEALLMNGVLRVGEIESGHIHTRKHELPQYVLVIGSGTDSTHDLGFSHI